MVLTPSGSQFFEHFGFYGNRSTSGIGRLFQPSALLQSVSAPVCLYHAPGGIGKLFSSAPQYNWSTKMIDTLRFAFESGHQSNHNIAREIRQLGSYFVSAHVSDPDELVDQTLF